MTERGHPFGWPPIYPTQAQFEALAPEWREKLRTDYEAEKATYVSSVLQPILQECGEALGVLRPESAVAEEPGSGQLQTEASQFEVDARASTFQVPEPVPCESLPEPCYNAEHEEGTGAADSPRTVQEVSREDRACPALSDRAGQFQDEARAQERAKEARFELAPDRAGESGEHPFDSADLVDRLGRPNNVAGLDGPDLQGSLGSGVIHHGRVLPPSADEHFHSEIERANREMNVLDADGLAVTDEPLLIFENVLSFMPRADQNVNIARRLFSFVEVTIVRFWYEILGWVKVLAYHCGLHRP